MGLYFIRHPETQQNKDNILQGRMEGEITPEGIIYARNISSSLASKEIFFDEIHTGTLNRTKKLAELILEKQPGKCSLIISDSLFPRDVGNFQGMKRSSAPWGWLKGNYFTNRPKGGETLTEAYERIKSYVLSIDWNNDKEILIVGHGETLSLIQMIFKGLSPTIENLSKIEEQKNCQIIHYNGNSWKKVI